MGDIRDGNQTSGKSAFVSGLGSLDQLVSRHNVDASRHASRWNLARALLHPYALPADKRGLLGQQSPFKTVVAALGEAYRWLCVSKLLFDVSDNGIALVATKDADKELRTDLRSPSDRPTDRH